jgi:hypothetical protein
MNIRQQLNTHERKTTNEHIFVNRRKQLNTFIRTENNDRTRLYEEDNN